LGCGRQPALGVATGTNENRQEEVKRLRFSTQRPEEDFMIQMKRLFFLLLAFVLSAPSAFAAARVWELDKAHSNFYFRVDHIYSKVQGRFGDYTGEIAFDPQNLADSRFYFEIKTASIDTDVEKRDRHLQSSDFFDSGKYPLMTFTSSRITDAGNGRYEVQGIFKVKGVEYELTLPLVLAGMKDHPAVKDKEVIGFNGELTIDRLAYKIGSGKFYDMGLVGKDVEILVTLEGLSDKQK
jgi:polyisoprenoid-binding protein YceI